uniref:Large ribosomal subunit protein uL23 n=1 Tax=candidate division WOR-3 bacterium TaxID=2052148 RepID=A0A7C4CBJ5_UNCW3
MIEPTRVILGALITEKAVRIKEEENAYAFRVLRTANKVSIRNAVEQLFRVHVTDVRVMNVGGKRRRMGMYAGRRPDWKKAIVVLKQGEKIEALEH